jgi:hypothetical protein
LVVGDEMKERAFAFASISDDNDCPIGFGDDFRKVPDRLLNGFE